MSLNTSPDLLLRQTLGVECACKALALFLLVPEYGQYPGMGVVVPVTRNSEWQCPPMAIGTTGTVPVALVPVRPSSRRYSLRSDTIRFIGMLYNGEYTQHRDVPYYASRLCVTPHYLSEICKKACGRPATYWIDRFTLHEIANLLCQKELPLSEIAARLNFSSISYFSRYVSRHFGISPNAYRESLNRVR